LDAEDGHLEAGVRGEDSWRRGTIDVYLKNGPEGDRYARIWNPRIDRQTGHPLEVIIPLEHVIQFERMPDDMIKRLYGTDPEQPATFEKRPRGRPRKLVDVEDLSTEAPSPDAA
jgi:hypothetical protein